MGAVPSTFHQVIKFPAENRVGEICEEPQGVIQQPHVQEVDMEVDPVEGGVKPENVSHVSMRRDAVRMQTHPYEK